MPGVLTRNEKGRTAVGREQPGGITNEQLFKEDDARTNSTEGLLTRFGSGQGSIVRMGDNLLRRGLFLGTPGDGLLIGKEKKEYMGQVFYSLGRGNDIQ